MKNIGILHIITDITIQSQFTHNQLAEMAIAGGADTIQFRQKNVVEIPEVFEFFDKQNQHPL